MRLLLIALLLTGCAETRIYERGQLVACIQGDCTNVTIRTPSGTYFHADTINHSDATKAIAANIGTAISTAGAAATIAAKVIP